MLNKTGLTIFTFAFLAVVRPLGAEDKKAEPENAFAAHKALFAENRYPSAATCRTCHPGHYKEWSVSPHAYAQLSPVFNSMHATIVKQTAGSNGDFCIRCHNQVGMNMGEKVFMKNEDRHPTSREGISCIVCHRVKNAYGKVSGRFALEQGDLLEPVYGPTGNQELKRVIESGDVVLETDREKAGRHIHTDAKRFFQLTESSFCGGCHDVTLMNGFRLEEAFSEFKNSPSAKRGETCQDCHMGKEPGVVSGYRKEPAAIIGDYKTKPRKRTGHMFIGPDYSIIHPGIFPHNDDAAEFATISDWIQFDWRKGWGTDEFEDNIDDDYKFPERWESYDDRIDARDIITEQLELLNEAQEQREKLLRVGFRMGGLEVTKASKRGLDFKVQVRNGTDGHSVPTGFDAERLIWLYVRVFDKNGKVVFQSGDLDPNGDVRDLHSTYVHNGELPLDKYLFNLQSKFITRNLRGGEREQVLAVNYSPDPIPFIRPTTFSSVLRGHPGAARKHKLGIPPLGHRWANYRVKSKQLTEGPYKIHVQFKAAMVPVNLISEIKVVGFDYNMSPRAVADAIRNGHIVLWDKTVNVDLNGKDQKFDLDKGHDSPKPAKNKD
ncbi:MAG: multiheme c-type cytochrome [Limisphaerales bacterium]